MEHQTLNPATAVPAKRPQLRSIQSARGIAAMLVAAFHLSLLLANPRFAGVGVFGDATWWGYRGVDFFFVLSGFILMLAHGRDIGRPDRLGLYAWSRASRVYPAYWLYTLVVVVISALVGAGAALALIDGPTEVLSTITLVRFGAGEPPVGVAWTLFHEILFYAAFAVLIANRRAGIALFIAWGAAILLARLYPTPHTPFGTLVGSYNLNFFFGIAAFWAFGRIGMRVAGAALAGSLVLLAAMIAMEARGGGTIAIHAGFALAFALAILGAARLERGGRRMTLPGLGLIGDASYSIYLTHATMQTYLAILLSRLGVFPMMPGWASYALMLSVTTAVGVGAYWFVERPLIDWTRALSRRREARARAAAA